MTLDPLLLPTVNLRAARSEDAARLAAIFGHYVRTSIASFEIDPPSEGFFAERVEIYRQEGYPFTVAVDDLGTVVGYAATGPFRPRPAYKITVETSVYLAPERVSQGLGARLLGDVLQQATDKGFHSAVGVIARGPETEASVRLHQRLGFLDIGTVREVGQKFGRLVDTTYFQKMLQD